ncbi:5-formyltetrahydrofolate cyclo-ligase [Desulfitispora alkaliphila]|uniref:5-formyltetrahydrofolate cyclo-ligase n=1 Tax=Desulfitispora alkaliphila TaxID=622674 RepID=UPI003D249B0C
MKKELRKEIIRKRNSVGDEEILSKSHKIHNHLFELDGYKQAKVVMIYVDFRNEVTTKPVIQRALTDGKKVAIPVSKKETTTIIPSELKSLSELTEGTWGILEPKSEFMRPLEPEEIDVVIVPGVAFDQRGNRLGYGAGYYDRFFERVLDTHRIALAFELQIVDDTYPAEHDVPMDMVITEERLIIPK